MCRFDFNRTASRLTGSTKPSSSTTSLHTRSFGSPWRTRCARSSWLSNHLRNPHSQTSLSSLSVLSIAVTIARRVFAAGRGTGCRPQSRGLATGHSLRLRSGDRSEASLPKLSSVRDDQTDDIFDGPFLRLNFYFNCVRSTCFQVCTARHRKLQSRAATCGPDLDQTTRSLAGQLLVSHGSQISCSASKVAFLRPCFNTASRAWRAINF